MDPFHNDESLFSVNPTPIRGPVLRFLRLERKVDPVALRSPVSPSDQVGCSQPLGSPEPRSLDQDFSQRNGLVRKDE